MTKRAVPVFVSYPPRPDILYRKLRIASIGHIRRKTSRVHAKFDHVAIGLIVAGGGDYAAGRRGYTAIAPGALFGVYPGTAFDYGPTSWWEEYYLGFTGPDARNLLASGLIPQDGRPRFVVNLRMAVRGFEQVMLLWKRGRSGDSDRACFSALNLLLDLFSDPLMLTASKKVDPVEAVLALCRERPHDPFDFQRLAWRYEISYSKLRQGIVRQTGLPPAKYLTRLRCQAACVQLVTTSDAIKQIANAVGIANPYTFSRTFHRSMGVSPQQYRLLHHAYS